MKSKKAKVKNDAFRVSEEHPESSPRIQPCPRCGTLIGAIAGSKEAICKNCGFKDPCCE